MKTASALVLLLLVAGGSLEAVAQKTPTSTREVVRRAAPAPSEQRPQRHLLVSAEDVRRGGVWRDDTATLHGPDADQPPTQTRQAADAAALAPEVPQTSRLQGNYPNPFNPTTTLAFDLAARGHVELVVYDVLGRRVAVLADGVYPAGRHQATFQGTHLPSGLYLAHLKTPSGTRIHTMILAK